MNSPLRSPQPENLPTEPSLDRSIFAPQSKEEYLEMCIASESYSGMQRLIRLYLEEKGLSQEQADEAVDEWYGRAFDVSDPGAPSRYRQLLEEIRETITYGYPGLTTDAAWSEIMHREMAKWDDLVETGLEKGWGWERISKVYMANAMVEAALRLGLPPEASVKEIRKAQQAEKTKRAEEKKLLQAERQESLKRLREKLGISPEVSDQGVENYVNKLFEHARCTIAQRLGVAPDDMTDEKVCEYLNGSGEREE